MEVKSNYATKGNLKLQLLAILGSICSTAIEHTLRDREGMDSTPLGAGLFSSLLYSIRSVSLIRSPRGGPTLLIFR